ncbi:MAG TPA: protein adenylyltransferase SelO family protein, partial [Mycobacterium sp.]|nr:protein adenylyltransferase SelO family protein [Mycobacterium sp.]
AVELALAAIAGFRPAYSAAWSAGVQAKLGLAEPVSSDLVDDLLALLQQSRVDWTSFFRALAHAARGDAEPARGLFVDLAGFDAWLDRWRALAPDGDAMDRVNPVYIPRNHLVEEALTAATGADLEPLRALLGAITDPFHERPGFDRYAQPAPDEFGDYRTFCGT